MVWCYSFCLGCGITLGSRLPDPERKRLSNRGGEWESPPEKGRQKSPPGHLRHKRDFLHHSPMLSAKGAQKARSADTSKTHK